VRKVSEKWVPPARAAEAGRRALVLFEIGREGQITNTKIEWSSGNALYDQAALRAVMDASPFPPLPREFTGRVLRVHLGFEPPTGRG
jgi:protein TonB